MKKSTINTEEVAQFDALGAGWWDESGPMRPLHKLNPTRMAHLRQQICAHYHHEADSFSALNNLSIVDIGCGGGLVTEPLSRMGAKVTGIDAGSENIKIAKDHAKAQNLKINYRTASVEALAAEGAQFDVVTALEIIEHVENPALFIQSCCKLVKPDGLLILSTLNRNAKSFALGILAAEYVLRWVPTGTHTWKKFVRPSELNEMLQESNFKAIDLTGLVYKPLSRKFVLSKTDIDVNYFLTAIKA